MKRCISWLILVSVLLSGCGGAASGETKEATQPTETTVPWVEELIGAWEAEQGTFTGKVASQGGFVTGFETEEDTATVTVTVPSDGFYQLEFVTRAQGGDKLNYISLDGEQIGEISSGTGKFGRDRLSRVYMTAGDHTVTVSKSWGYIDFDKVYVYTAEPFDESVFDIPAKLINPNATDNARRLMSYLCDIYGQQTLSGQYCDSGISGWENIKINEVTGRFPAVLGMDVGYYSQTGIDHGADISTTEQAIAYWEKGGIVTLCWHWLAPEKYVSGTWYSAFRPEHTNMNLTRIMAGEDPEGMELLLKDIGNVSRELQKMQEAGVPILWRPLHEASGGWFWWGAEGPETYKKLYILLYETMTNEYGLNNLIWVWNGQHADWYPGDEYVDIVGIDIYAGEHVYTSQSEYFSDCLAWGGGKKLVILSENGTLIDPELSVRDRAMWGLFCTWGGEFVITDGLRKTYSEQYTDKEMLTKVYNSDYVVTRDELPDLKNYPIREDAQ